MENDDRSKRLEAKLQALRKELNDARGALTELQKNSLQYAELQSSAALFRSLVESMPQNVFSKDLHGRFTFANRNYCATEGKSLIDILGKTDFDLHPYELAQKYLQDDQKIIQSGETVDFVEIHQPLGEDKYFVHVIKTPVNDSQGRVVGLLGMFWDITEEKKVEEERLKIDKLESLGLLAGGIAHDFNNWLTGLFGNLELAKIYLTPDHKSYQFINSAGRSMENLIQLTRQLLTFAKGGEPIKECISIGDLIVETATFSIRGSNIKLRFDIQDTLWSVLADKGQLSQVISNLVINAQQAMPTGGTITIHARNSADADARYIKIDVHDQGIGIAKQHLNKIFDPYFTTKQKGSGLGLSTTHSIITKHNGNLSVTSHPNAGTCFTITLPAEETTSHMTPPSQVQASPPPTPVEAARILVMDDDPMILSLLETVLTEMGHNVTLASTGQDAVECYRDSLKESAPYNLVILDLTIPGEMGGKRVAREIIKMDPDAKLIVSSGYATDDTMAQYKKYGFKARVTKPYSLAELGSTINILLNQ